MNLITRYMNNAAAFYENGDMMRAEDCLRRAFLEGDDNGWDNEEQYKLFLSLMDEILITA